VSVVTFSFQFISVTILTSVFFPLSLPTSLVGADTLPPRWKKFVKKIEVSFLCLSINVVTQLLTITFEGLYGIEPYLTGTQPAVQNHYISDPYLVLRIGIEPTKPLGDKFTVC
jgi:hypothetical protein